MVMFMTIGCPVSCQVHLACNFRSPTSDDNPHQDYQKECTANESQRRSHDLMIMQRHSTDQGRKTQDTKTKSQNQDPHITALMGGWLARGPVRPELSIASPHQ
jgi:hypothetical protein